MKNDTIRMLPVDQTQSGPCHICDQPALLAFEDRGSDLRFGKCCLPQMIVANRALANVPPMKPKTTYVRSNQ